MTRSPLPSLLALLLISACSGGSSSGGGGASPTPVSVQQQTVVVDANTVTFTLAPLWRDHYDLSVSALNYRQEPGFSALTNELQARSLRCSVGRWEVGLPVPSGGDSLDPVVLRAVEREYYRGPNTLAGADDPGNYDFGYLDGQLSEINALGMEAFLCFDYMPFTLSSEQNPMNANNLGLSNPSFSFSNGIRTAPPADDAVYARVVRNVMRHCRGLFAGSTNFNVTSFEIGNEPDLVGANAQPTPLFWTGTRGQFFNMVQAIVTEVVNDPDLNSQVRIGAGSFAAQSNEPTPRFVQDFLASIAATGTRLDFLSYHSYDDDAAPHFQILNELNALRQNLALNFDLVNGEWGRALDGSDPVYDQIEHGLLRFKVMIFMELFGVTHAHEALFRDPAPGTQILGLIATGPVSSKPVTDVYKALNRFNDCLNGLSLQTSQGSFFLAGRNNAATKLVLATAVDDPGAGQATDVEVDIPMLPWGAVPFQVRRYEVSEASHALGQGPRLVTTTNLSGGSFQETLRVSAGEAQLIVWELERQ